MLLCSTLFSWPDLILKPCGARLGTTGVPSKNYWVSAIKKTNKMAYERKLLNGPEHSFCVLHKSTSCSSVGKYPWKAVGNHAIFFDSWLWRELLASLQSASTFVRRISARIASYTDQRQLSEIHSFLQRCHVPNTSPSITEPCMHALAIVMSWIFYGCFFWSHGYSQGKPRPG